MSYLISLFPTIGIGVWFTLDVDFNLNLTDELSFDCSLDISLLIFWLR